MRGRLGGEEPRRTERGTICSRSRGNTDPSLPESPLWYFAAACQFKETNKNPSQARTYTELMKLKRQGRSFAEDSWQGPQKWIRLVIRVGTICRSEL